MRTICHWQPVEDSKRLPLFAKRQSLPAGILPQEIKTSKVYLQNIPLAPEQCVTGFGTTLIVAPHADDESLGCGGAIALLRKYGQEVFILLLSDGTLSHPNSTQYPSEKLRDLREAELENAATILGVPAAGSAAFEAAVQSISGLLNKLNPQSIFVPWRRDPHPDHRAAFQLIKAASTQGAKLYEYPIWLEESGHCEDAPKEAEVTPFRLDISSVLEQKQQAIAAHLSQTTNLISDDPEGFTLSQTMLDRFKVPYETFFLPK